MTTQHIEAAAQALRNARAKRGPIAQISQTFGISGLDAAYAVAEINQQHYIDAGARVVGKKVGLTSKSVQAQLGVDQPDFGLLFADMEYLDGDTVDTHRLIQPKAEAEIAFVIGSDLNAEKPTYAEFVNSVAYALPAIEIVDSAIEGWKLTLVDTVADNASSGLYVLGNQPVSLAGVQLASIEMQMDINGSTVSTGSGAACLGHPLRAAYWLACTMGQRGQPLRAGEVILSGALGPMAVIKRGDRISAHMGVLGSVSCVMA